MPTSGEFRCRKCGTRPEVLPTTQDTHPEVTGEKILLRCPSCGEETVVRSATWRSLNPRG